MQTKNKHKIQSQNKENTSAASTLVTDFSPKVLLDFSFTITRRDPNVMSPNNVRADSNRLLRRSSFLASPLFCSVHLLFCPEVLHHCSLLLFFNPCRFLFKPKNTLRHNHKVASHELVEFYL